MLDGYSKHCTFPYRPCESCSKHDVSAVPQAWRTTPMASSLFQIPILSNPYSSVHTSLSLSLSGNRSAKMSTFSNDSSPLLTNARFFPIFILFFIEFVRLSISKAIEKDLKINIEILGWTYSYANDNDRRQGRSGVVSMSIRPSSFFFFPFSTTFPSTLSSEYWLLGANGLRYRLIQMRTGFHSKLDGATVSAML